MKKQGKVMMIISLVAALLPVLLKVKEIRDDYRKQDS
ncbi:hypothetical protein BAU18_000856 [Enterococcus diestrammenae]|uniref:Uncharacterized protein n=1 Tax=Enterococcus diestrammenae TaxID=1155073 RepID=A0ABV0F2H7_9ENTE